MTADTNTNTAADFGYPIFPAIDALNKATGRNWNMEMTGGGCHAIVLYIGSAESPYFPHIMVTAGNGPLSFDDTIEEVETNGEGWMVGYYPDEDSEGEIVEDPTDTLAEMVAEAAKLAAR